MHRGEQRERQQNQTASDLHGAGITASVRRAQLLDAGREESEQCRRGVILKMIRDEGVGEVRHVEDADQRRHQQAEAEHRGQWTASNPVSPEPESGRDGGGGEREEVLPGGVRAHLPARIDADQIRRPGELRGVEPDGASGDEKPLEQGQLEAHAGRTAVAVLDEHRREARGETHGEQRSDGDQVASLDSPALPPDEDENGGRENHRHRLGEQR